MDYLRTCKFVTLIKDTHRREYVQWKLGDGWREEILDLVLNIFSSACSEANDHSVAENVMLVFKAYLTDYIQGKPHFP